MLNPNTKLLLLSDIDACVTDWFAGYASYMKMIGKPHNGNLPARFDMKDVYPYLDKPWEDAVEYQESIYYQLMPIFDDVLETLKKLSQMGVEVHFVTSCGQSKAVVDTRNAFMRRNFNGLYTDVNYLGMGEDKAKVLAKFAGCGVPTIFIDDLEQMLMPARELGYTSVLKDMKYNQDSGDTYERVSSYSGLIAIAERLIAQEAVRGDVKRDVKLEGRVA